MTHPPRVAENWTTHPLPRAQKLMTHPPPLCFGPPHPILFDQFLIYICLLNTIFIPSKTKGIFISHVRKVWFDVSPKLNSKIWAIGAVWIEQLRCSSQWDLWLPGSEDNPDWQLFVNGEDFYCKCYYTQWFYLMKCNSEYLLLFQRR